VHIKNLPQDGRIAIDTAAMLQAKKGRQIDVRVCFLPTGLGEDLTARLLDSSSVVLDLDRLPYSANDRARMLEALARPWGVIVVSGPTGSGKTTTLYAALNKVSRPEVKVASVEDPIEYYLPWVSQVRVRQETGFTFAHALRAIFRSDPDVVLVGEIRNLDVLNLVLQLSLTGHLLLTTLHAGEAVAALVRMLDIGADPFVVADATKLIVSQRLVRKLCPACSKPAKLSGEELAQAYAAAEKGGIRTGALGSGFRTAVGCPACAQTGYRGRTVIAETLALTPEIGVALRRRASAEELRAIAIGQGMTTMMADGIRRASLGETTVTEVMRVAP
jgi:type II secretory ATPase GspE/PulE/Tfp pilus assembly ATPase PilB-like protein